MHDHHSAPRPALGSGQSTHPIPIPVSVCNALILQTTMKPVPNSARARHSSKFDQIRLNLTSFLTPPLLLTNPKPKILILATRNLQSSTVRCLHFAFCILHSELEESPASKGSSSYQPIGSNLSPSTESLTHLLINSYAPPS